MDISTSRYRLRRKWIHLTFYTYVYFYTQIDWESYQWTISLFGGHWLCSWELQWYFVLGGGGGGWQGLNDMQVEGFCNHVTRDISSNGICNYCKSHRNHVVHDTHVLWVNFNFLYLLCYQIYRYKTMQYIIKTSSKSNLY